MAQDGQSLRQSLGHKRRQTAPKIAPGDTGAIAGDDPSEAYGGALLKEILHPLGRGQIAASSGGVGGLLQAALKGNADKAAALQTALASCGNCQIGISTYTGTGTRGEEYPTVITFPKMPTVFFVRGRGTFFAAQGGASEGSLIVYDSGSAQIRDALLSWSGNQLSIVSSNNAKYQLNTDNSLYWVLALYQMDA